MRTFILAMMVGLLGCSALPQPGWAIGRGKTWSVACFRNPEGLTRWHFCGLRTGETQYECETLALLNFSGELLPPHTSVAVYEHAPNSVSKVLVTDGEFAGEKFFCPTDRIFIQ